MLKKQHQLFVTLLCVSDGFVIATACVLAWLTRKIGAMPLPAGYRFWPHSWESYFKEPLAVFVVPVVLYSMWLFGLYKPRRDRSILGEQVQILKASALGLGGVIVILWSLGNSLLSPEEDALIGGGVGAGRVQLGLLAVMLPLGLIGHRWLFRALLRVVRSRGWNRRHVAVIGVGRVGRIACQTIERNSWTGLHVAYFISHRGTNVRTECLGRPVLGGIDQLEEILESYRVDAVYIAIPSSRGPILPKLLERLDRIAIDVRIIPDVNPRYITQGMVTNELDGMPILSYRESPLCGLGGVGKRALDIVGSALCLLVFSPLMLALALAVRTSGPGPIIFKQRRVSLGGDVFKIYKFRTMRHVEDETGAGARWTRRDDPRITPVGRWLRKTSLDELPQLLNVLKGDMSLVGPRPERPELIDRFREDWRGYMLRQHVKAGMTGWAQVNGLRGDSSLKKRLQYDLFYIRNWSLWLDLRILVLTPFRGFVNRNAH